MVSQVLSASASGLVEQHLPLARQISARLRRRCSWVAMDELYSYSLLGLTRAAGIYDPAYGVPFANFASQKAMFLAIDEMRKDGILQRRSTKSTARTVSLTSDGDDSGTWWNDLPDESADEDHERFENREFLRVLLTKLPDGDRQFLVMYYADEMTLKEIARVVSMSESSVCLRHKALINRMRKLAKAMTRDP